ncbi:aldose 1-epimerase [Nicoletella semolina]|uniref:Aldose 1-epimerase n=1 Tax=Nicoletella semolina TaxID=271160 RepID=A0A4R2NC53_9PAST|nr:galactose-1-epimerase [Nicoletella semolina]MDH2925064.1 galactose mutarotase [Nicoletella semolina]TCP18615.1 aldose 1-epimerase [Nicoletella semolina]
MNIFVLENSFLQLTLSDFGASWLSCKLKLAAEQREVLVTTSAEYWHKQTAYFGATIGRYANRIAHAQYQLNGKCYRLAKNNGEHNLHSGGLHLDSGQQGADRCVWTVLERSAQAVRFGKIFAEGEQGFGGEVTATVEYRLNGKQVEIYFNADTNADTPLNLTNHAYFNLQGSPTVLEHQLQIWADYYLPVGTDGIPNAPLRAVENTSFDFRKAKKVGAELLADDDQKAVKGYDHAFLLSKVETFSENSTASPANAVLSVADLSLELRTSMPALQLYTGNWLAGQPTPAGKQYGDYAGLALEPEFLPNSPNQPELAQFGGITKAGEPYQHFIFYQFNF